jgi:hypothetical protein
MANIRDTHYAFDLHLDRISTNVKPDLNAAEKDWFLKEAQLLLIKRMFSTPRRSFETSERRIQDLSTLVIKGPLQPPIIPVLNSGVAEVPLSQTAFPFLFLVSAQAKISVPCIKVLPLKFTQHDDLTEVLRDPFNSPSLEFLPYNVGRATNSNEQSLYIYPGTTTIDEVYPEYVRRPKDPSLGTYVYLDGITYPAQDLEVPEHLQAEVIDLAVHLASLATQSPEYVQLRTQKIILNE